MDVELIMSTLTAFGHHEDILNILVDNRMMKNEYYFLRKVQEMMGMVEIDHPGLHSLHSIASPRN